MELTIFNKIKILDDSEILSLWQTYKSLSIKNSTAGIEFEKALLARMTELLDQYDHQKNQYSRFPSLNEKEISLANLKFNSFQKQVKVTTGYHISYDFLITKRKSFLARLFGN